MDPTFSEGSQPPEGDFGQDIDFDLDDDDFEESGDLMRVVGIAGGVAAVVGGLIILLNRRRRTPAERLLAAMQDGGQDLVHDVRQAVAHADLGTLLGEALDQANGRLREAGLRDVVRDTQRAARQAARQAAREAARAARQAEMAAGSVDLEAAIQEVGRRMANIQKKGWRGARRAQRAARHALHDLDLGSLPDDLRGRVGDLWEQVSARANDVGWDQAVDDMGNELRRLSKDARRAARHSTARHFVETLREQAGAAADRLPTDRLADVQATVSEELLPEARQRAREVGEALAAAFGEARQRGSDLADEYGPQVRTQAVRTAAGAGSLVSQLSDLLRGLALEVLNRVLSDVLPTAQRGGTRVAETVRDDTLPWIRHRAGEVRDRVRDDVAPRVAEVAAEAPDRVREAVTGAGPMVADALSSAADTVGEAVARVRPKAAGAARDTSAGIGGALSSVGRKAGAAVNTTVGTTRYVTGESSRILFWLTMLAGLVVLVFVPDAERQKEIWHNVQQFLGEVRSMWSDFSDEDFEDADAQEYTGDAGV